MKRHRSPSSPRCFRPWELQHALLLSLSLLLSSRGRKVCISMILQRHSRLPTFAWTSDNVHHPLQRFDSLPLFQERDGSRFLSLSKIETRSRHSERRPWIVRCAYLRPCPREASENRRQRVFPCIKTKGLSGMKDARGTYTWIHRGSESSRIHPSSCITFARSKG